MGKIYVAYGSNLNIRQMSQRCPGAELLATGYLKDWILLYRGGSRCGGVATIQRRKGYNVPVALWSITESDELELDRYEGYPWLYKKHYVMVHLKGWQRRVRGMAYIMTPVFSKPAVPGKYYIETIREGYRNCKLEMEYLYASLEVNLSETKTERH